MSPATVYRIKKIMTIFGAFLIHLPTGLVFLLGNLLVYVYSYYRSKNDENKNAQIETPWLPSIAMGGYSFGYIVGAYVAKLVGQRATLVLGMFLFYVGIIATYFTLNVNTYLVVFTLGFLCGLGHGVIYSMTFVFIVDWSDYSEVGLMTSILYSSSSLGAIILNQLVTRYVNPQNLKPNLIDGPTRYFTQEEILERVPNFLMIFSTCSLILFVTGFSLIRKKPARNVSDNDRMNNMNRDGSKNSSWNQDSKETSDNLNRTQNSYQTLLDSVDETTGSRKKESKETSGRTGLLSGAVDGVYYSSTADVIPNDEMLDKNHNDDNTHDVITNNDISTREMLKTKSFYSLWFTIMICDIAYFVIANYYKIFGQGQITNDHFLTDAGTVSSFAVLLVKLFSGAVVDKIGFKETMVISYSVNCLMFCFYYFTPSLNQWLFFFPTIIIYAISVCTYTNYTAGVVKLFGKKYFGLNVAIIYTAPVITNLSSPPIMQWILAEYGWFHLFISVAALNFIGLLLIILFLKDVS